MATPINIVAQYCEDSYYQNYRQEGTDFFTIDDFVFHAGSTVGDFFRQDYDRQRTEIRQEKSDEIVGFSEDLLVPVTIPVKNNVALFPVNFMSFAFDRQTSGIQKILITKPVGEFHLERTNLAQIWQLRYLPFTNTMFWYYDRKSIKFYNKGIYNVQEIDVLYVPGVGPDMLVPDSLLDWTVNNTVQKMHQIKQGTVVKKSIDLNPNTIPETEINKMSVK